LFDVAHCIIVKVKVKPVFVNLLRIIFHFRIMPCDYDKRIWYIAVFRKCVQSLDTICDTVYYSQLYWL